MLKPRWIKLLRDIQAMPARLVIILIAIATGVFGLATLLSCYTLVTREVSRNYLATHPASASLRVERIDAEMLAAVRRFPGVAYAQASATVAAHVYAADGVRHPLTVFIVEDFNHLPIIPFSLQPVLGLHHPIRCCWSALR